MPGAMAILSPAKTLDMTGGADCPLDPTRPRLASRTKVLAETLRSWSPTRLEKLMSISRKLAEENAGRWKNFGTRSNPRGPAALCFRGDVYQGLEAWTLTPRQLEWAQDHVRILSGLFGLLRPLDAIQAYRLEMGTSLKTTDAKDLYGFWGAGIHTLLAKDIREQDASFLVNLASEEYSRAAMLDSLDVPVINVKFMQVVRSDAKFIAIYAKKARGLMARWMATRRPRTIKDLAGFDSESYALDTRNSSEHELVFKRPKPTPAKAAG
ncbi:MAG: hypothetical protein CMJ32_09500 [Phycisphaerae bacterium]|nr:hypothetical protein [Phycisphaerae bacterium]